MKLNKSSEQLKKYKNREFKGLLFFVFFLLFSTFSVKTVFASEWQSIGDVGFSIGTANYTSLALDSNDTPYVAFKSVSSSDKATVMKFDGTNWVTVGAAGFSAGYANYTSLALDSNDTPYVAYVDGGNGAKATVKKFDGTNWVTVGAAGFSAGQTMFTSLALDGNDVPYVVYQDAGNGNKATVKKFDGTNWVTVGTVGFSAGRVDFTSIAIDKNNIPYVTYMDGGNSNKATVKKFDGTNWITVGTVGFSPGQAVYTVIALDKNNTPYVAFRNDTNNYKVMVMKLDGASWFNVGGTGFSGGEGVYLSLSLDSNDTPYVSYRDYSVDGGATLKKFDGTNWVTVGTVGFSDGMANYTSLALSSNNVPYIAYRDDGNGYKATVLKFDVVKKIEYSGSFTENGAYSGSVVGLRTAVITGDTFVNAGSELIENTHYTLTNKPDGLTPIVSVSEDGTVATLTFTGNTVDHLTSNSVANLTITFLDGAFTNNPLATSFIGYTNNTGIINFVSNNHVWEYVGGPGFSVGEISKTSFALDSNNTPYIAFVDQENFGKATVMKFDGTNWLTVGEAGFTAGQIDYLSLVIDNNNVPYIAYTDTYSTYEASVMKFNGSAWEYVGAPDFSEGEAYYTTMYLDNNIPYVAFYDTNYGGVSVMKFIDNAWEQIGVPGFSSQDGVDGISLIVANDVPYVGYTDYGYNGKATVKKFNGSTWEDVGPKGFTTGTAYNPSIVFNNDLYIAFHDETNGFKASVMKYNGVSWEYVGAPGFSPNSVSYIKLAFDVNSNPYVAFSNEADNYKAMVMKFDGDSWSNVGELGYFSGQSEYLSFKISNENTLYVSYKDVANSNKATVIKFAVPTLTVSPSFVVNESENSKPTPITVTLDKIDTSDISFSLQSSGQAVLGTDYVLDKEVYTILAGQTSVDVLLTPINNYRDEAGKDIILTLTSNDAFVSLTGATTTITLNDDDVFGVTVTDNSMIVHKNQTTGEYKMVLNSEPLSDVVIYPVVPTGFTINPIALTFTASNWNEVQSFTITLSNPDSDDYKTSYITHYISSEDKLYSSYVPVNASVSLININSSGGGASAVSRSSSGGSSRSVSVQENFLDIEPTKEIVAEKTVNTLTEPVKSFIPIYDPITVSESVATVNPTAPVVKPEVVVIKSNANVNLIIPPAIENTLADVKPVLITPDMPKAWQNILTDGASIANVISIKLPATVALSSNNSNKNLVENITTKVISENSNLEITETTKAQVTTFIAQGTNTTKVLGMGERAGVVSSFVSAYNKLPATQIDWQDVVKLANGRWPQQRNESAENKAKQTFAFIYKRQPDNTNSFDNNAIATLAYGLRPTNRNLESEKQAINTFKVLNNRLPQTASDWDTIRAIAYSGAKR